MVIRLHRGDCDDTSAAIFPGAEELCNGLDDNCDGQIDEGVQITYYIDSDGDGFGDRGQTILACDAPSGYSRFNTDCNDSDSQINPRAAEQCNGIDDNCDALIDETCVWDKTFSGNDIWESHLFSIIQANEDGYVAVGSMNGAVWMIRMDESGNELWEKTLGGGGSVAVVQGNSGGYILAGEKITYSYSITDDDFDALLIKVDEEGNELWKKTFGGPDSNSGCDSVIQSNDGGYIIVGYLIYNDNRPSGAWLMKVDENGNELWSKIVYSGDWGGRALSVIQGNDGGYVIAGDAGSDNKGQTDAWVIKIDDNGEELWRRTFDNKNRWRSRGIDVIQSNDGGYIIAKRNEYDAEELDSVLIMKIDEDNSIIWKTKYNEQGNAKVCSVIQGADGGYLLTGYTQDMWALKIDEDSNKEWTTTIGSPYWDRGYDAVATTDGGYIIIGTSETQTPFSDTVSTINYYAWLVKLDKYGNRVTSP